MKLINSKVEILEPTGYTIDDIYKQIEIAGRTCYKSEDKITPTSAKEFVDRMIKSGHGAMLEHGTVYLDVPNSAGNYNLVPFFAFFVNSTRNCFIPSRIGLYFSHFPTEIFISSLYIPLITSKQGS